MVGGGAPGPDLCVSSSRSCLGVVEGGGYSLDTHHMIGGILAGVLSQVLFTPYIRGGCMGSRMVDWE